MRFQSTVVGRKRAARQEGRGYVVIQWMKRLDTDSTIAERMRRQPKRSAVVGLRFGSELL